jgi:carboxylesterase type B
LPQQDAVDVLAPNDVNLGAALEFAEAISLLKALQQSEDFLNINVQVPKDISPDAKLPIMMWM